MKIKYLSQHQLEKTIINVLSKYLNLKDYKIFFFGSRVEGKGSERSDIDIGIEGQNAIAADKWLDIQEEIENIPTLYTIDVVDFKRTSDNFKKVALKKIEPILP
ncbi:MAG: nucleotidyltransferase domain-containing protein [candidate division WOR-3 bacterium]